MQPDGEIWIAVKVQPRASANEVVGEIGNELKIKVTAPPVDSAANEALIRFLASAEAASAISAAGLAPLAGR